MRFIIQVRRLAAALTNALHMYCDVAENYFNISRLITVYL